jgi:thioredoxin reductase (NADPH)
MNHTKVAIIGAGPAGASCAIYNSRAMLEPIMFAGLKSGGQLMFTSDVENYAGFPDGVKGPDLMINSHTQAQKFGTKIEYKYVTAVDFSQKPFKLWTNDAGLPYEEMAKLDDQGYTDHLNKIKATEPEFTADTVVITTGSEAIRLGVPGEDKFFGRGVSVCAVCDAAFYKDKDTVVIGGGDSAMEDSMALAKFAKSVTIIHRRDSFKASKVMQERVLNHEKIKVLWNSELKEVIGENKVSAAKIFNSQTNETTDVPTDGVFMAIGHKPVTKMFKDQIQLDKRGYIVTRQSPTKAGVEMANTNLDEQGSVIYPTMTNIEGVFAAGDQVDTRYKQAIVAAGAGSMAAIDAERWYESNHQE